MGRFVRAYMGTISVSLPSDGETADVSDYNTPIQTIVDTINGGLDNANIASGAAIDGSKLADNAVTTVKITDANVTAAKIDNTSFTLGSADANGWKKFNYNGFMAWMFTGSISITLSAGTATTHGSTSKALPVGVSAVTSNFVCHGSWTGSDNAMTGMVGLASSSATTVTIRGAYVFSNAVTGSQSGYAVITLVDFGTHYS